MSDHPSHFELDLFHLTREASPALRTHLDGCEVCQDHLRALQAPEPLPEWAATLPARRPRRDWWRWLAPLGTAALVASLLWVVVPQPLQPMDSGAEAPAFSPKGHPAAQVHVRRGEETLLLASDAPLRPGDRIRLSLHASGLPHYVLFAVSGSKPVELAKGQLSSGDDLIPGAWEVDASSGAELLRIVFSAAPLSDEEAREAAALLIRSEAVWTLELRLTKETR